MYGYPGSKPEHRVVQVYGTKKRGNMGTMIEFDMAIDVAKENVKKLVPHAKDITVEGAIISDVGKLYEVTLSYELEDHRLPENSSKIITYGL